MLLTAVGIICDTQKIDPLSTSVNNAVQMLLTAVGIICDARKIDPLSTPVNNVLMFITELSYHKLGYSAINTAKRPLSNIVSLTDCSNIQVGKHFLIKRFLKGVYNKRRS